MTGAEPNRTLVDAAGIRDEDGKAAKLGVADWLRFAATPTFLVMALLTFVPGGGRADMLCSTAHASTLGGMALMYVLMSVFHAAPWLRLISGRWSSARQP